MYQERFPTRRMPDHKMCEHFNRQLCETGSIHVAREETARSRAARRPDLDEGILKSVDLDEGILKSVDLDEGILKSVDLDEGILKSVDLDEGILKSISTTNVIRWQILSFFGRGFTRTSQDVLLAVRNGLWFQHDGAPAHFTLHVRKYLDALLGRNGWAVVDLSVSHPDCPIYLSLITSSGDILRSSFRRIQLTLFRTSSLVYPLRLPVCGKHLAYLKLYTNHSIDVAKILLRLVNAICTTYCEHSCKEELVNDAANGNRPQCMPTNTTTTTTITTTTTTQVPEEPSTTPTTQEPSTTSTTEEPSTTTTTQEPSPSGSE